MTVELTIFDGRVISSTAETVWSWPTPWQFLAVNIGSDGPSESKIGSHIGQLQSRRGLTKYTPNRFDRPIRRENLQLSDTGGIVRTPLLLVKHLLSSAGAIPSRGGLVDRASQ
jgi:hypothetical protein